MPDIDNDPKLKKDVYDFFNFVYLEICFLKSCNGHNLNNIYNMMLPILEKKFSNKTRMIAYLIMDYIKSRNLKK